MKFSMPGSPFQNIWHVYEPAWSDLAPRHVKSWLTWFLQRDGFGDILHEDAALELQLRLSVFGDERPCRHFVLGLVDVNLLAAEQDHLEEVDLVLALLVLRGHALALEHRVLSIEEQIAESFNPVAFPVLDERLQLFYSLDTLLAGDGIIGALEDGRCRFDAAGDVVTAPFVQVTLVAQLLSAN